MKILVTGAAGLIGSHTTDLLLDAGHVVDGIDDLSYGTLSNLSDAIKNKNFKFIHDKVENIENYKTKYDVIYHFASLKKAWDGSVLSTDILDTNYHMTKKEIPLFKVFMSENAAPEVAKVLNSGYVGQGPKVEEFEKNLKDFFNVDYLLTINSATSAEHLALHMLKKPHVDWPGIEEGDEVLCTPLTCTASNWRHWLARL